MGKNERKAYLKAIRTRYRRARKKAKVAIPDFDQPAAVAVIQHGHGNSRVPEQSPGVYWIVKPTLVA